MVKKEATTQDWDHQKTHMFASKLVSVIKKEKAIVKWIWFEEKALNNFLMNNGPLNDVLNKAMHCIS